MACAVSMVGEHRSKENSRMSLRPLAGGYYVGRSKEDWFSEVESNMKF